MVLDRKFYCGYNTFSNARKFVIRIFENLSESFSAEVLSLKFYSTKLFALMVCINLLYKVVLW